MINAIVLDAPAGIDGSGRVRTSGSPCATVLPPASGPRAHVHGTGLPWVFLLSPDAAATGGAMPTGTAVPTIQQPAVLPTAIAGLRVTEPLGTTSAYSTLGNHSPGRPRS
jgi:hypothetical protein